MNRVFALDNISDCTCKEPVEDIGSRDLRISWPLHALDSRTTKKPECLLRRWRRDGFARGRDPRRHTGDDLVHLPVSSEVEDRKRKIQERSRNTVTDDEHCSVRLLRCNCGGAGLAGAASHHRARMTQISGGPRAEQSPGSLFGRDNEGWSNTLQPQPCSNCLRFPKLGTL